MDTPLSHREFEELAAGWVLSVLEPDDEAAFRRHLATCERCERDVRELEGVVGDLAYAAPPAEPPAALWPTIRGQLGATARARPRRLRPPRAAGAARSPWVVRLAAAAGVVLLVGLALWNVSLRDANDAYRARVATLDQVVALANDPTTRAIALKGAPAQQGARVTVLASSRQDRGALLVEGLPPPPAGKVYELWGVPGGQIAMAQPAVVFLGSARPRSVLFSLPIQPTTVFAVTAEPAPHGSRKPTSQPILIGSPSAPA